MPCSQVSKNCYTLILNIKNTLSLVFLGMTLLIVGGIHLGWSVFSFDHTHRNWGEYVTNIEVFIVHATFFIGACVGAINGGYFIDSMGRRNTVVSFHTHFVSL